VRLLVATHSFRREGAALILCELIAHLRERQRWAVDVLHPGDGPLAQPLRALGVRFVERAARADYDVALVNSIVGHAMVGQLARALPVVLWVHEGRSYVANTDATPRALAAAFAAARAIVVQCAWQASRVFASFLSDADLRRVHVVPCGVRDLTAHARGSPVSPAHTTPASPAHGPIARREHGARVAFVGSVHPRKRVADLARAIARLDDVDLECVAIGATDRLDRFGAADRAAMTAHPDRFRLLGAVEDEDLPAWLASSDFFCHPSGDETQAMATLEAAHFGLPAAISRLPAYEGIWTDGTDCLMHAPGDVEHLARNLRALALDAPLRAALGHAAREVARRYPMDAFLARMAAILEQAGARPVTGAGAAP